MNAHTSVDAHARIVDQPNLKEILSAHALVSASHEKFQFSAPRLVCLGSPISKEQR
jgi:hypothetical protein